MNEQLNNGQLELLIIFAVMSIFFIFLGFFQLKFPPKEINSFYGYRTSQSKSSTIKWHLAQEYSAKWIIQIGGILLASHLPFFFLTMNPLFLTMSYMLEMLLLFILMVVFTEKKMRELD